MQEAKPLDGEVPGSECSDRGTPYARIDTRSIGTRLRVCRTQEFF